MRREIREELAIDIEVGEQITTIRHAYTHFKITLYVFACRYLSGEPLLTLPSTTMLGALCAYITTPNPNHFQPMKANYGLMPALPEVIKNKESRFLAHSKRASGDLSVFLREMNEKEY